MKKYIHKYLPNGLEVYLEQLDFAPVVSMELMVKVGSIDEEEHEGGMAHVLEHMLFKGTDSYPVPGEIDAKVENEGGDLNAYTTFDHTLYHINSPISLLWTGLDILTSMASESIINPEELKKELEVIREEMKRDRDNPSSLLSKNMFSSLMANTPFAKDIIGEEDRVMAFSQEEVMSFYKKWYAPNNMVLVVVGQIDCESVFSWLSEKTKSFLPKDIAPRLLVPTLLPQEQNIFQRLFLTKGPWNESRVQMGFQIPEMEESLVFDVLSYLLGGSESSHLVRTICDEEGLVTSIDTSTYLIRKNYSAFFIEFICLTEKVPLVLQEIVKEIFKLTRLGFDEKEILKAKTQFKVQRLYSQETMKGMSSDVVQALQSPQKLSYYEIYEKKLDELESRDIESALNNIWQKITKGSYCIALVCPEKSTKFTEESLSQKIENTISLLREEEKPLSAQFSITPSSRNADIFHTSIPLEGGRVLKINWKEDRRLPLVNVQIGFKGGLVLEAEEKGGIAGMTASLLTRGTEKRSYENFIEELELKASSLYAFSTKEVFGIRCESLKEHGLWTLHEMLDCLFCPAFDDKEFEHIKRESIEVLSVKEDSPSYCLAKITQPLLFPNHSYKRLGLGSKDSLMSFTVEDTEEYWKDLFESSQEIIVSVVGDFSVMSFLQALKHRFTEFFEEEKFEKKNFILPSPVRPKENSLRFAHHHLEREQAHIYLSFRGFSLKEEERISLEVLVNILSHSSGRLFMDLREQKSLAYTVTASQTLFLEGGYLALYIGTNKDKVNEAIRGLKENLEAFLKERPPLEAEVMKAKSLLLGARQLESQTYNYQSSQLCLSDLYGLGFDYFLNYEDRLKLVDVDSVLSVIKKILKEEHPIVTIVGPQGTEIDESFKRLQMI